LKTAVKKLNTRAVACKILEKVVAEGKSFHPQLISTHYPELTARDIAFVSHLCFGVLRYYPRIEAGLKSLLKQELKTKDLDVKILLILGLYQLFYSDTAVYACMNETVEAVKQIKKPWAQGLVNGILRNAQRMGENINPNSLIEQSALPKWLAKKLQHAWPEHFESIVKANIEHPPFVLRVNSAKITQEAYLEKLNEHRIEAENVAFCPEGILVKNGIAVDNLPGFHEGLVSVQDGAAQLAASLLQVKPRMRVLDACAAPGGKTAHLLEMHNDIDLLAVEKDASRVIRFNQTMHRLGFSPQVQCADATQVQTWWDGKCYDRILIDAPCSATGIIRRHPDIKLHRQSQDVLLLAEQQKVLLEKLWPLLKPNGILLYVTCSVLPQENVEQMALFLQNHLDAKELPILEAWGLAQKIGRQILPGQHHMDGFYYARLVKQG
jgi:16S rRNA (cytosine967-C5)-methyltransferase